jgi:tetratricopeptide (TPR) repeat protein
MFTLRTAWKLFLLLALVAAAGFATYYVWQPKPDYGRAQFVDACKKLDRDHAAEAIAELTKVVDANSNHALAFFYRALAHEKAKESKLALEDYSQAIKLNDKIIAEDGDHPKPDAFLLGSELYDAHVNRGKLLCGEKKYDEAIADFAEAIRIAPERAEAYCGRGTAFLAMKLPAVALDDLSEATHLDPKHVEALRQRANACLQLHDYSEAAKNCRTAIRLQPKSNDAYYTLALALLHSRTPRLAEAEAYIDAPVDQNLELKAEALAELAGAYVDQGIAQDKTAKIEKANGDHDKAATAAKDSAASFSKAVNLDSKCSRRIDEYRVSCQDVKRPQGITETAKRVKAPDLEQLDMKATNVLNSLYVGQIDPGSAVTAFTAILNKNAESVEAWYGRGIAFSRNNLPDSAIEDFNEAIRLEPRLPQLYRERGGAYAALGDCREAIRDCTKSLKLEPNVGLTHYYRAVAYVKDGDYDRAVADLDEAVAIDPTKETESRHWYAEIRVGRGLAAIAEKRWDDAVADLAKAVSIEPDRAKRLNPSLAAAYRNRAVAETAHNDFDEAAKDFDQAVRLDPKNAENYRARGLAAFKRTRLEAAKAGSTVETNELRRKWESVERDLRRAVDLSPGLEYDLRHALATAAAAQK